MSEKTTRHVVRKGLDGLELGCGVAILLGVFQIITTVKSMIMVLVGSFLTGAVVGMLTNDDLKEEIDEAKQAVRNEN